MIYRTLNDTELRRVIDNELDNLPAAAEGARRFLEGSDEHKALLDEIGSLTVQLADADRYIEELKHDYGT